MRLLLLALSFLLACLLFLSVRDLRLQDLVRSTRASLGIAAASEQWTERSAELLFTAPPRIRDLVYQRDSTLVRWAAGAELRIWIDRAPAIEGWTSDLPRRVKHAISAWEAARLPLRVRYVDQMADANVHVVWMERFPGETLGTTELVMNDVLGVQNARVLIALHDADGLPVDREKVDATILHEAGHLFGLVHTDDDSSSMHPRSRATAPSSEDIEVLQMLYRLPMGRIPPH